MSQQHFDFYFTFYVARPFFIFYPPGLGCAVFLSVEAPKACSATDTNKSYSY